MLNKKKVLFLILFPLFYALANEIIFSIYLKQGFTLHKFMFALMEGLLLCWLGQVCRRRMRSFLIQTFFAAVYSLVYGIQLTYYTLFGTPFYLKSLGGAGAAVTGFFGVVISSVLKAGPALTLIILLFVIWVTVYRKWYFSLSYNENWSRHALVSFLVWTLASFAFSLLDFHGAISPSYMLLFEFAPTDSVREFGMIPTAVLDLKYNIFHLQADMSEIVQLNMDDIEVDAPGKKADEEGAVNNSEGSVLLEKSSGHEHTEINAAVYDPAVYNVLNPDFSKKPDSGDEELNEQYLDMNAYFSHRAPTKKNEYTGMFKGKNLILITAEAFSKFILNYS